MHTLVAIVLALTAAVPGPLIAQGPAPRPLTVRDVLGIAEFADRNQLDLSPDGGLVAFALQDPRRAAASGNRTGYFDPRSVPRGHRGADVFVTDTRTGVTRRLSNGTGSSWAPVWSPNGRYLAYYSDRDGRARVWLWDRERDTLTRLSDAVVRVFFGFEQIQWAPDGARLLVKVMPVGTSFQDLERLYPLEPVASPTAPGGGGVTARVLAFPVPIPAPAGQPDAIGPIDLDAARSFLNAELADLALIDVPSGAMRRVARRVRAMGYRFAPAGDRIAFTTRQPNDGSGMLVYDRYDVWVAELSGAVPRVVAPGTSQEYGLGFSWSPDGGRLASVTGGAIQVTRVSDGAAVQRFERAGRSLAHSYRPPLWLDDAALIVPAADTLWRLSLADGSVVPAATTRERRLIDLALPAGAQRVPPRVLVATSDRRTKRAGFHRVELRSGEVRPVYEDIVSLGATDLTYSVGLSRDEATVAFVAEQGGMPPEVWISHTAGAEPRRLTSLHAALAGRELGSSRLIDWTGRNGEPLQGALLLPAGYQAGRRYPLVVKVYGGSRLSNTVNRFGLQAGVDNLQLLATRGYAVLLPDAPTQVGTPAADIAGAVLSGIDAVVALGVADPERVAIMGHSYGGYSALAVAVQAPRVRAVISSGGFSNLFGQYTALREDGSAIGVGWAERDQGRMGGHPWENRDQYLANSPFFQLDRITAPVLLLHGGSDRTVLATRAEETFVGLRRLGRTVTLVRYDGEDHHPGSWSEANATDYWDRIFGWLDRYLAP